MVFRLDHKSKYILAGVLLFGTLLVLAGCSAPKPTDNQSPNENRYSKDNIEQQLNANQDIFKINWAPDNTKAVYIQAGKPEKDGLSEAYLWQVGKEKPQPIRDVSAATDGFVWSPDSCCFLISEKIGEVLISSIFKADSLDEEAYKIKSISMPIWGPDSLSLVYGNEQHDYGESWGSLEIYRLGAEKSEYVWKSKDYQYKAEYWNEAGDIGYTETNDKGQTSQKTTKNIHPSISGVHLGDTKDQVREALGDDYKETAPSSETGHFPEQVYRWDYDKGFIIFIGADSGQVLEIIATSPQAETNLGIKNGDTAAKVFEVYRSQYIEPESIHGGKIYGLFKVEGAAALAFSFDLPADQSLKDIKPDNRVIRMILTYPEIMDDSF